ncbi:MAG: ABC transporter permease [Acidobacteriota bacterium]|nr:ABC transporter permease [Acidobacteriota bacterium]
MGVPLIRRVAATVPLLLAISAAVFGLLHLVPGGPLAVYLSNPDVRPEDLERLRRALGLDQPVWRQYLQWLAGFVTGDWGFSYSDGRPVAVRVWERLPATVELVSASLLLAAAATLPLGLAPALGPGRWTGRAASLASAAGLALPVFWFGLVLQLVFALGLGWLPSSGRTTPGDGTLADRLVHLVLPATMLAAVHAAAWGRYLRAAVSDTLRQPFVAAARARGAGDRTVLWRHALRPALLPVVTIVFLDAALMVAGTVVTESVFAWPGLGSLFTEALARRDYTVLMTLLMLASTAVVAFNLAADVLYPLIDPRVRG